MYCILIIWYVKQKIETLNQHQQIYCHIPRSVSSRESNVGKFLGTYGYGATEVTIYIPNHYLNSPNLKFKHCCLILFPRYAGYQQNFSVNQCRKVVCFFSDDNMILRHCDIDADESGQESLHEIKETVFAAWEPCQQTRLIVLHCLDLDWWMEVELIWQSTLSANIINKKQHS